MVCRLFEAYPLSEPVLASYYNCEKYLLSRVKLFRFYHLKNKQTKKKQRGEYRHEKNVVNTI